MADLHVLVVDLSTRPTGSYTYRTQYRSPVDASTGTFFAPFFGGVPFCPQDPSKPRELTHNLEHVFELAGGAAFAGGKIDGRPIEQLFLALPIGSILLHVTDFITVDACRRID